MMASQVHNLKMLMGFKEVDHVIIQLCRETYEQGFDNFILVASLSSEHGHA